jgi:hypothetical protein
MQMKIRIVAVTLLLSASGLAQADYKLVPTDDSPETRVCVAALSSNAALRSASAAADIKPGELDTVRCNGSTLDVFVNKYREVEETPAAAQTYVFDSTDNNPETRLCFAAVTSSVEFSKLKSELFSDISNVEEEVLCNGMPLKRFALKYAGAGLSVSQR